jgi:predicted alpha/beta-fold hydrolase
VLLYCYNAFASFNSFSSRTLPGLSEDFLCLLLSARRDDPHRPIIFIGHSLGGLVINKALHLASSNPRHASINDATQGVVFFGTPHRGMQSGSSLESIVHNVLQKLFLRWTWEKNAETPNPQRNLSLPCSSHCHNTSRNACDASFPSTLSIVSFYESIGRVR